jgi:hypothetical protein
MSAGTRNKASAAAGLALLLLGATGCAPEFAEVSEIETLRVLGVKKDKPYAAPGEEVTLSMLWSDGSPDAGRPIKRAWLAGVCTNPVGDSFVGCFQAASELFAGEGGEGGPAEIPDGPVDLTPFLPEGDTVTFTIPEDIISERAGSLPPGQVPYGLSMVFFFACAGERFVLDPSARSLFPIICEDADGNALGPDDYVAGYSSIYAYEDIRNDNPIVSGFLFRGEEVEPDCIGEACIGLPITPPDCDEPGAPCVPVCEDDGDDSCPVYEAQPIVDRASAEQDEVAQVAYGSDFEEQLWINYYVDGGGSISPDVKLVNDATKGWNEEQAAEFRAPKDPGPVAIWALVHDNRGGVEFARFTVGVTE